MSRAEYEKDDKAIYDTRRDPCKKQACLIQACLRDKNFQEDQCADVIELMRQCCLKWHKLSICCSGIKLDPPK